jgi:hypothetical protein
MIAEICICLPLAFVITVVLFVMHFLRNYPTSRKDVHECQEEDHEACEFSYQYSYLGRCGDAPRLQEEEGAQDSGGAQIFPFFPMLTPSFASPVCAHYASTIRIKTVLILLASYL